MNSNPPKPLFMWSFVAFSVVIFVSLSFLVALPALREIQETITLAQFELVLRARDRIDSFLERNILLLSRASSLDSAGATSLAKKILDENPQSEYYFIHDLNGKIISSSLSLRSDADDFPSILKKQGGSLLSRELVVGPVFLSANGEPSLLISARLGDGNAAMSLGFDASTIWDFVSELRLKNSDIVYLLDAQGRLALPPRARSDLLGADFFERDAVTNRILEEPQIRGEEFTSERFFEGRRILVSASKLSNAAWWVVIESPSSEAFAVRNRIAAFAVILVLANIVILILLIRNAVSLLRTTRQLSNEKDHLKSVLNVLEDGIIEHDSQFRIFLMNPKAEEISGARFEEVKSLNLKDTVDRRLFNLFKIVSLKSKHDKHLTIERGSEKVYLEIYTLEVERGGRRNFIKIIKDISRNLALVRMKSEFISVAAHQLRTPLAAIKWAINILLEGEAGKFDPAQEDYLKKISESNERMVRLVSDLLDASRIEEGRFGYEFKEADFQQTLKEVLSSFELEIKEKYVTLEVREPPQKIQPFSFDPQRIKIAVYNLVANAINYTPPSGKVVVEFKKKGEFLQVSISDTGIGIPQNQRARIFSKFFRADNAIHMKTEGSGLGLFITRNIIKRHGGDIYFSSEIGKGTTFVFTLPLKKEYIPDEEKAPLNDFLEAI